MFVICYLLLLLLFFFFVFLFYIEQITQGLRTLELCVDNLTADFLDPILAEVQAELMMGIWQHIRPPPYPHGGHALRILGKLGGRNRRFLKYAIFPKSPLQPATDQEGEQDRSGPGAGLDDTRMEGLLEVPLQFGDTLLNVSLGPVVSAAKTVLASQTADLESKVLFVRFFCLSFCFVVVVLTTLSNHDSPLLFGPFLPPLSTNHISVLTITYYYYFYSAKASLCYESASSCCLKKQRHRSMTQRTL